MARLGVIVAYVRTGSLYTSDNVLQTRLCSNVRVLSGRPLRIPVECVRTYAGKRQNFTISGCSFIGEYDILGLVQQIGIEGVGEIEIGG